MKKGIFGIFLFVLLFVVCACQDVTDPSAEPSSSGQQLASQPSSSTQWPTFQKPTQTKPTTPSEPKPTQTKPVTPTEPEPTLPENCDDGHTFPGDAPNCAVCGIDYYSATLYFMLSSDGTHYIVWSIGDCRRTTVIVPEIYNGLPVEVIGNLTTTHMMIISNAPESFVTHVVLPDTIRQIGVGAFSGYRSLVSINIPDAVSRIEQQTFGECESLVDLTLPKALTYIGDRAFIGCMKLKDLQIPEGVTHFGDSAFSGCAAFEELRIPEEMTEIPKGFASDCTSLKKVICGDHVTKIGQRAFEGCVSLQTFTIGEKVTDIGSKAFAGCKALTNIVLPDSVTKIEAHTFYKCENLEYVVIGSGVKTFERGVFEGCNKLKAIYYRGTQAQWEQIKITEGPPFVESTNPKFGDATIYFYSETAPTEEGNFWHYVDGKPTPWESEE